MCAKTDVHAHECQTASVCDDDAVSAGRDSSRPESVDRLVGETLAGDASVWFPPGISAANRGATSGAERVKLANQ
jgi:hypothetical protein